MIPWIVTGIVATWRNNLDKESVPRAPGAADTSMPRHTLIGPVVLNTGGSAWCRRAPRYPSPYPSPWNTGQAHLVGRLYKLPLPPYWGSLLSGRQRDKMYLIILEKCYVCALEPIPYRRKCSELRQ